jgi:hypothetical protein
MLVVPATPSGPGDRQELPATTKHSGEADRAEQKKGSVGGMTTVEIVEALEAWLAKHRCLAMCFVVEEVSPAGQLLLSGHSSRCWGTAIRDEDGQVTLDPDLWPAFGNQPLPPVPALRAPRHAGGRVLAGSASLRSAPRTVFDPFSPAGAGRRPARVTPVARKTSRRACRSLIGLLVVSRYAPLVEGFFSPSPPCSVGG